jgi:hypothetical protein
MTFCLYQLALNPVIQERLRAEIDTVLQKHGGNITYESIFEMEYLDNIVQGKRDKAFHLSGLIYSYVCFTLKQNVTFSCRISISILFQNYELRAKTRNPITTIQA